MEKLSYNRNNFHKHTFCIFKQTGMDSVSGQMPNYTSKSGSSYYFTDDGVYRLSNHWGRAANCRWRLDGGYKTQDRQQLGFALWTDFHPDNEHEKLYFIAADFETQTVQFYHKASGNFTSDAILRTASETMKRIKQIRQLFAETAWSDYLKGDVAGLRREIIQKMITTDGSFHQIRKEYL